MKRLFLTFAAMLLMSVSAISQSSETPLKGDVNEDGVVDVADITAIIAIIKNNNDTTPKNNWYLGTLTEEQLLSQDYIDSIQMNQYSSTPVTEWYFPDSNSTTDYVIWLAPASWGTPWCRDNAGNNANGFSTETTGTYRSGYTLMVWENAKQKRGLHQNIIWR